MDIARLNAALVEALATSPHWEAARNLRSQQHGRTALEIAMLAPAVAGSATTPAWTIPGGAPHATPSPAPTPPPATTATPTDGEGGGGGGEGVCSEQPGEHTGRTSDAVRTCERSCPLSTCRARYVMTGDQIAAASAAPRIGSATPADAATETSTGNSETETDTQTRASSPNPFLAAKRTAATLLEAAAEAEAAATLAVVSDDAAPSYSAVHADPRYATVYSLLRAGVDVDAALSDAGRWPGQSPLHFALRAGDNELVRTPYPAWALATTLA